MHHAHKIGSNAPLRALLAADGHSHSRAYFKGKLHAGCALRFLLLLILFLRHSPVLGLTTVLSASYAKTLGPALNAASSFREKHKSMRTG
jgi:hypothetical protein